MMNETPDGNGGNGGGTAAIEQEIAELAALITQARELVASGHTIDLAGLTEKIGTFCAGVAADPPADAESVTAMIEALVDDLTALGREMTAQQREFARGGPGGDGGGDGDGGSGGGSGGAGGDA